ncbi:chondroadherin-like protein, partial [Dinothrombium tinctorium]
MYSHVASCLCPPKCECNEKLLNVSCLNQNLNHIPITLNPKVRQLFLSKNRIKSISISLNVYLKLEKLSLSANRIASIEPYAFQQSLSLRTLLLDKNQIFEVTNETFKGLNSLRTLKLSENLIERIMCGAFRVVQMLEELDLSSNRLSRITESTFDGLMCLKYLSLRGNLLKTLPNFSQNLASLMRLDLGLNFFENETQIGTRFVRLDNLKELNLDYCQLPSFVFGVSNAKLNKLNLRGNRIAFVEKSDLALGTRVHCVDIRDNAINCNCSWRWFQIELENRSINCEPMYETICANSGHKMIQLDFNS